jgi:TusA-related sulfurtransferase
MTYVRTKVKLEEMEAGEVLEIRLRGPEPVKNVPRSAREEGHEVVSLTPLDAGAGEYRLVIRKRGP